MCEACNGKTVLWFVVLNAVTAYNNGASLIYLVVSALEYAGYRIEWKAVREA